MTTIKCGQWKINHHQRDVYRLRKGNRTVFMCLRGNRLKHCDRTGLLSGTFISAFSDEQKEEFRDAILENMPPE